MNNLLQRFESNRWPHGPTCPYCESQKVYHHREHARYNRWQCAGCRRSFTALTGTFLQSSHVQLPDWDTALRMLIAEPRIKPGKLAGLMDMRPGTASSILRKLRANADAAMSLFRG